jgi:predicted porin
LAASGASFAQSSVEIYGVIDQAYAVTNTKYTESGVFDGTPYDSTAKLKTTNSGTQSGLATQRLGFRGTEDLGGGLKAKFQIENSLSAGNATTNGFGSRPTFVGLEGGFGTILLGRQDTVSSS